jgi:hypothetical protein
VTDWRLTPGEKGQLIWRNIQVVRTVADDKIEAVESVITVYHKDLLANIEVLMHKHEAKLTIASQVQI